MIKYVCDGRNNEGDDCKNSATEITEWLTIASDNRSLSITNNLKENRLISMYKHSDLHFCSKACFINLFFMNKTENP